MTVTETHGSATIQRVLRPCVDVRDLGCAVAASKGESTSGRSEIDSQKDLSGARDAAGRHDQRPDAADPTTETSPILSILLRHPAPAHPVAARDQYA